MIFITGPLYSGKRTFARTLPGHCIADVQQLAAGCKDNAELEKLADKYRAVHRGGRRCGAHRPGRACRAGKRRTSGLYAGDTR